ncbi:MAG TPA: HupE/UreJ family protein [Methylomirabilota bacterium]|nr:HupE/UreJ family protein [Methylomirabilota bacterium]
MTTIRSARLPLALLAAALPATAFAHPGGDHVHSFVAGLEHPVFGLDHLAAMVAVGMIAVRAGGRAVAAVPAAFVAAMVVGAALGLQGLAVPAAETGIALSLVVLGAVVALYRPLPLPIAAALVASFGLAHGFAHGAEAPVGGSGLGYPAGFVLATAALHASGVAAGLALAGRSSMLRAAGVATAAFGALALLPGA